MESPRAFGHGTTAVALCALALWPPAAAPAAAGWECPTPERCEQGVGGMRWACAYDRAWRCEWRLPGESRVDDGFFLAAVREADRIWRSRGRDAPAGDPSVNWMPGNSVARAELGGTKVWIGRAWARGIRRRLARGGSAMVAAMAEACHVALHERGHNHGLRHARGMLDFMNGQFDPLATPRACWRWGLEGLLSARAARSRKGSV